MKTMSIVSAVDVSHSRACSEIDYWKSRAVEAEEELKAIQEEQIKSAGLWDNYVSVLRLLGGTPAERVKSCY